MSYQVMLTTVDNPFDPSKDFESWFLFDVEKGYNSCAYLGRIAKITDKMSDSEVDEEIERAIDEIVLYDPFELYKKVRFEREDVVKGNTRKENKNLHSRHLPL